MPRPGREVVVNQLFDHYGSRSFHWKSHHLSRISGENLTERGRLTALPNTCGVHPVIPKAIAIDAVVTPGAGNEEVIVREFIQRL